MTALAIGPQTSAFGSMFSASVAAPIEIIGAFLSRLAEPPTASGYQRVAAFERTTVGPAGRLDLSPVETTAEAILEIRRKSGLTWEELGDLFDVSRRSVHHWANGNVVSAGHERVIRAMLAAIRRLDCGEANATRALLLSSNGGIRSTLDCLKDGRFDEAVAHAPIRSTTQPPRVPLSPAAVAARRPPAPTLLLEADQTRPEVPTKPRLARALRTPKATG